MLIIDNIFKGIEEYIVVEVKQGVFVGVEAKDELGVMFKDFLKSKARLGPIDIEDAGYWANDDLVNSSIFQKDRSFA